MFLSESMYDDEGLGREKRIRVRKGREPGNTGTMKALQIGVILMSVVSTAAWVAGQPALKIITGETPKCSGVNTSMVESKPVVTNGLEFIAATEAEWVCDGTTPIQVQLLIHNTTHEPLLFSTFDTFGIIMKDSQGKEVKPTGGRDATLRTRPVLIGAGETYCLSRKAELGWNPDGKTRSFRYYDGTGSEADYGPLATGNYTLSFWCDSASNPVERAKDDNEKIVRWHGKVVTKEVAFAIKDRQRAVAPNREQ